MQRMKQRNAGYTPTKRGTKSKNYWNKNTSNFTKQKLKKMLTNEDDYDSLLDHTMIIKLKRGVAK